MNTMTLLPLRDYPRGLTVIPAEHQATFRTASDAAHSWADRYGIDVEDGPLAAMFLAMVAEIEQAQRLAGFARAEACAVRDQLEAAQAELSRLREVEAAAVVSRRLQAERRDRSLREQVRARDGDNCRYCGTDVTTGARGTAALDHVVPALAIGADNVVVACRPCRRAKTRRTPEQAGMCLRPVPITVRLTEPAPSRKEAMQPTEATPVEGQFELIASGEYADEIRLTVTYPEGVSPRTISVAWTGDVTEPTPDELVEMINQLRPNVEPATVSVTGVVAMPVPPWMRVAAAEKGSTATDEPMPASAAVGPPDPGPQAAETADGWPYGGRK